MTSSRLPQLLQLPRTLVADGAIGTMLIERGIDVHGAPAEELTLSHPEMVVAIHADYVGAGADVIGTNSFGCNRIRLERFGQAAAAAERNEAAARLARAAAGDKAAVVGSIGPIGALLEPLGPVKRRAAVEAFAEQARALAAGGVDGFLLETHFDLQEVLAAIEGIRGTAELPVLCTLTFERRQRTMMGVTPERAAEVLAEAGVSVIGANCGGGPDDFEEILSRMRAAWPEAVLMAKPNAGLPEVTLGDGRAKACYHLSTEAMAAYARAFKRQGVKIVGSCCGSTPAFTRAIAQAVAD
ncbi:MAG: homocysteine S-methyltransferase family protein [Chloroflexota bacterium]|nr:homocysteine S-methyltransferase family protein [Chloroflexota bacterium]